MTTPATAVPQSPAASNPPAQTPAAMPPAVATGSQILLPSGAHAPSLTVSGRILMPSGIMQEGRILMPSGILLPSGILMPSGLRMLSRLQMPDNASFVVQQQQQVGGNVPYLGLIYDLTVYDEDGNVVPVYDLNGEVFAEPVSDSVGVYHLRLPAISGRYRVRAQARGVPDVGMWAMLDIPDPVTSTELNLDMNVTSMSLCFLMQQLQILNSPAVQIPLALFSSDPVLMAQLAAIAQAITSELGVTPFEGLDQLPAIQAAISEAARIISRQLPDHPDWLPDGDSQQQTQDTRHGGMGPVDDISTDIDLDGL
ncbi:MAG: carboxypeptidase-like regulatory domain-containing protein [Candidatus Sericytochromatia bacterium]